MSHFIFKQLEFARNNTLKVMDGVTITHSNVFLPDEIKNKLNKLSSEGD